MDARARPIEEISPGEEKPGRSLIDLIALLARNRRLLIGLPLGACVAAIAFSFVLPERYTVDSRFVPETSGPNIGRLAGLAAQFGMDIGGGSSVESVDFYAELLESHDLLRSLALTNFTVPRGGRDTLQGNLIELLEAKGETEDERIRNTVDALADLVVVRPDPAAKLVTLRTSAPWPALAVSMNARLLELLGDFNVERRQSRAAAERRFLEARLEQARGELTAAEQELQQFLTQNRRWDESAALEFEHTRLTRRVTLREQIHASLAEGYEQARVDEVRNTPVITVIDHPRGPAKKTAPRTLVNGALGAFLGLLLAMTILIVREVVATARRRDPERFEELRRALRAEARRRPPESAMSSGPTGAAGR